MATKRRNNNGIRATRDFLMALLMFFFGAFILASKIFIGYDYFVDNAFLQGSVKWIVGILFILYGVFRAYRGYTIRKNGSNDE